MKVKVIKIYDDKQIGKRMYPGKVFIVNRERGDVLIKAGVCEKLQDEKK